MENIFDYSQKTSRYFLLAQLYDKLYGGLIPHNLMACPTELTSEYSMEKYLTKKTSAQKLEKAIVEYIIRNNIKDFICERLKKSADLRYLLYGGLHDALIESVVEEKHCIFININYEDCIIISKSNTNKCQIVLENVFQSCGFQVISGLYIDGLRIYFESADQIKLSLLCHNRGNVFTEKECSVYCKNVRLLFY